MVSKVIFVGRATAEVVGPYDDWALISIGEPDASNGPPKIKDGWLATLRLSFHDVDPDHGKPPSNPDLFTLMNDDDARSIVAFVRSVADNADVIMVHCRAGISRSAAVAKWIAREYKLKFDHRYEFYNKYVYRLLDEAGNEA
jgi:predicted protein tyrosine phosphatase